MTPEQREILAQALQQTDSTWHQARYGDTHLDWSQVAAVKQELFLSMAETAYDTVSAMQGSKEGGTDHERYVGIST